MPNNLKNTEATQFQSGSKAVENGRKGGKKSGQVRREKANLKKAIQQIVNSSYTAKGGQVLTGEQLVAHKIMEVATDKDHKNWSKAVDYIFKSTEDNTKSAKDILIEKQIELLQAKIDALTNIKNADRHDGKLADLIEGLMVTDDIHEETAAVNGTVAEQETEKNKHS